MRIRIRRKSKSERYRKAVTEGERIGNARVGYQVAMDLALNEGQASWFRSSAMIVANSLIFGGIAGIYSHPLASGGLSRIFVGAMGGFGIFLCFLWFCVTARSSEMIKHWSLNAYTLEDRYLSDPLRVLSHGRVIAEGGNVIIDNERVGMNWFGRRFRLRNVPYWISGAFIILHLTFGTIVCATMPEQSFEEQMNIKILDLQRQLNQQLNQQLEHSQKIQEQVLQKDIEIMNLQKRLEQKEQQLKLIKSKNNGQ